MSGKNGRAKHSDATELTMKNGTGKRPVRLIVNSDPRTLMSRRNTETNIDPRRDYSEECGWPELIRLTDYFDMDERNDYANRVNRVYQDECWSIQPQIYETEKVRNTPFEKDVLSLTEFDDDGNPTDPETNLISYWHQVDIAYGIGHYGGLFYGIDDGKNLSEPVDGIDKYGRPTALAPPRRQLLFLRALDERFLQIIQRDEDPNSPRRGKPTMYSLRESKFLSGMDIVGAQTTFTQTDVHWSRVIHVSEGEVVGQPRTKVVFNRLLDVMKILGSSAEMFYQCGFPGLAFSLDPRVLEAGGIDIDEDTLDEQMYLYSNRLQRWLNLVGYDVKSLAPNITEPTGNLTAQLQAISTAIGVPLRIFLGAEQAQLASGQDVRTWNRRLIRRLMRFVTPRIVRPTIDRLISVGVIRRPKNGVRSYKVFWPDINIPNADERSTVGDRLASSLMKYMQVGAWQIMHPHTFFTKFLGFTIDEADAMIEELKTMPPMDIKTVAALGPPPAAPGAKTQASGASSSGVKGRSPSKPPKGGKT